MSQGESQHFAGDPQNSSDVPFAPPAPGAGLPPQFGAYPPAPPAKKKAGLIIGLAVGAVVVAGGIGAYAALGGSNGSESSASASATHPAAPAAAASAATGAVTTSAAAASPAATLSLPSSADGLVLLTTANAKAEVARVRSGVEKGGAVYNNALFGAYGPKANGGYRVVMVDQAFTNMSAADQSAFESYAPSELVQTLVGAVKLTDAQVETSTDSGAALSCGNLSANGVTLPVCVWDDSEGFGFTYFYATYFTTDIPAAARYTDALRAAAEGN